MADKIRRECRQIRCPEEDRTADLMIEWREENGKEVLNSVHCDNPRLADLDNWDCRWTCMETLKELGIEEED
jgi:hypothetical protein